MLKLYLRLKIHLSISFPVI